MDEIVKQAMAKWPNVPHCYGWLMLDARGAWRMRDEAAQAGNLPGDKLAHVGLLAFINRNYASDARGCWYFQNGPQRVYVDLEATPYIARTDADGDFILHTDEPLGTIDQIWFTEDGKLLLQSGAKLAQLDDRDLATCLPSFKRDGTAIEDAQLLEWIAHNGPQVLMFHPPRAQPPIAVNHVLAATLEQTFGFVRRPQPSPIKSSG